MTNKVNIPLDKLQARRDFNSHVALEFCRDGEHSEYIAFNEAGPRILRTTVAKFEERYYRAVPTSPERVALTLLRSLKSAYLPGDGVADIVLEIYIMAKTNNTDLTALSIKELIAVYNDLAKVAKVPELNSFKESKVKLIAKIEALQATVKKPTGKQAANKGAADAKGGAATKGATGGGDSKGRGMGVGKFCMDLIQKGKTNSEVLDAVKKQFPEAKTSASSVAWYRNKLKSEGAEA